MTNEQIEAMLRAAGLYPPANPAIHNEEAWRELGERLMAAKENDLKKWQRVRQQSWVKAQTTFLD